MAKLLWIFHESDCGGRAEAREVDAMLLNGAEIVSTRVYVHWWRKGYDMDWTPPEWILDVFPSAWDKEK